MLVAPSPRVSRGRKDFYDGTRLSQIETQLAEIVFILDRNDVLCLCCEMFCAMSITLLFSPQLETNPDDVAPFLLSRGVSEEVRAAHSLLVHEIVVPCT